VACSAIATLDVWVGGASSCLQISRKVATHIPIILASGSTNSSEGKVRCVCVCEGGYTAVARVSTACIRVRTRRRVGEPRRLPGRRN
jgi:hypothetical protein